MVQYCYFKERKETNSTIKMRGENLQCSRNSMGKQGLLVNNYNHFNVNTTSMGLKKEKSFYVKKRIIYPHQIIIVRFASYKKVE